MLVFDTLYCTLEHLNMYPSSNKYSQTKTQCHYFLNCKFLWFVKGGRKIKCCKRFPTLCQCAVKKFLFVDLVQDLKRSCLLKLLKAFLQLPYSVNFR